MSASPWPTQWPIQEIPLTSSQYPALLAEIADPPKQLFVAGSVSALYAQAIALVGSRQMTPYGDSVCQHLATECATAGYTIVSGLAAGIDSVAHRTALQCQAPTIAVVANGLHPRNMYPKENVKLAHSIIAAGGAIVSEYPIGTSAKRYQFPARNRIIAGLSLATVVVEARHKSGALITAYRALEYNREVFAVPGSIFSPVSAGTHGILQNGATLVHRSSDIFQELPPHTAEYSRNNTSQGNAPSHQFDDTALEILNYLSGKPCTAQTLHQTTQLDISTIHHYLTDLEIKGIVRKNIDFTYSLAGPLE